MLPLKKIVDRVLSRTAFAEDDYLYMELSSERLFIRPYQESDFEQSVALYGDPTIIKYFDHGKPFTRDDVRSLIQNSGIKHFQEGRPLGLFSIFKKDDMSFVGHIDLLPTDQPGILEIGFILHKTHQGLGFCTESVNILLQHVEQLVNDGYMILGSFIKGITATVHPKNIGSKRVLEKSGMTLEKSSPRFGQPRLWYFLPFKKVISWGRS